MTVPETKQRPPILVWATAAVAVVLLVGLPLFLFRGGGATDPATTIAALDPTTTTVVDEPTTTTSGSTTVTTDGLIAVPPTSGDCAVDWAALADRRADTWYVFYGCDRPGMEDVLVPIERGVMSVVSEDLPSAMLAQLEGPSQVMRDAGYFAFSVEDGEPAQIVEGYSGPPDVRFDFTDFSTDSGMANASASTASMHLLAQLSSVVLQFPDVESVTYSFDGSCDAFWNWLQRDCGVVSRSDWAGNQLTAPLAFWWDSAQGTVPTTTISPTSTTLPGEAFDIGPRAGDVVAVVGVHFGDVLNVRAGPGTGYEIVATLDPLAADVVATGRHRLLPGSIWDEVTVAGVTGWVNSRFVGYLGLTDDLTAQVVSQLGAIPEAETMVALGDIVAESFRSEEGGFRYTVSVAPAVGDLGEIGYDVLGLADDAQLGYRLHIFGQPTAGGEGFSLMSVEATAICGRGVTTDGLCV